MFFAWARRAALGVVLAGAGCSAAGLPNTPLPGAAREILAFNVPGVLTIAPGESVVVSLRADARVKSIKLALEGSYGDASIDEEKLEPSEGSASFRLHAPRAPSTFGIRATSDDPEASVRLDVAVGRDGFATVRVTPNYKGVRPVTGGFVASAFVLTTCRELGKNALSDGSPARKGNGTIDLPSVPAGGSVAVVARAGHFAVGCADITDLAPESTRTVVIDIYDRPIDVTKLDLQARLTFTPDAQELAAWNKRMADAAGIVITKFSPLGTPQDESNRLLDAMQTAAMNNAFGSARQSGGWDGKTTQWLAQKSPSLRARAQAWLDSGQGSTLEDLVFHLGPAMNQQSMVMLGPTAQESGVETSSPFSVAVDADDTLRLEGPLDVWPTARMAGAAGAKAKLDVSSASDVPSALAKQIDCDGLAGSLMGNQSFAYAMCDRSCVRVLCEAGLAAMWNLGRGFSEKTGDLLEIHVNGSGPVTVGDAAEPLSLTGKWSGQVKGGQYKASTLHGEIKAAKGMAPN